MTAATTIENYRYIGVTDDCVECQRCGKPNLKSTVVLAILDVDGSEEGITYYGSSCAARALGVTGRGASAKVLGLARRAHYGLINEAYDGRTMLKFYGLPETGKPTPKELADAIRQYQHQHRGALWFHEKTADDWHAMVLDMIERKQGALAEAARLGATVPASDREMSRFINNW